ncbi:TPA: hypothetical protein ACH3X1_016648 [Trebouxia sp. C0004]
MDPGSRVAPSSAESHMWSIGITCLFSYPDLSNSTKVLVQDPHVREYSLLQRVYCCAAAGILESGTAELLKSSHLQAGGAAMVCCADKQALQLLTESTVLEFGEAQISIPLRSEATQLN